MKSHWVLSSKIQDTEKIAVQFNLHPAIASILLRRGLKDAAAVAAFLKPSPDSLQSPFQFTHMQKAIDRIRAAIARGERILIYGDYDVDGITGSAVLYPVLKRLGADVEAHIPHRVKEGYGLNIESLARRIEEKFSLVITVDNGITGVEQIQFLRDHGVDTIIVDHHTPKGELPPAYAIVSVALDGKGEPNLAACGVAFKLAWALAGSYEAVKDSLDLVAVGTVADVAPALGDNRVLLKEGLALLATAKRPGLRALMDVARISRKILTYRDIAFGIAPRINASGRMDSPEHAFRLLTTDDAELARQLAKFLDEGNRDRQRVEADAFKQAALRVEEEKLHGEAILVLESEEWHEGVIGIVAARLVERYKRPAIVISLKNGIGKGSGRSLPSFSLFDCVLPCEDLLVNFGGHSQACGLTIQKENIGLFRSRLNEVAVKTETLKKTPPVNIDGELPFHELDLKFLTDLRMLEPFGPGNKKPLFLSRGLKLKGAPKKRGQDTLQCWMTDESARVTCEVVGFRAYQRWTQGPQKTHYDLVYQPVLNEFGGIASIQLEVEDWV